MTHHDGSNGLERMHHQPIHLIEELLRGGATACRLEEEAEVLHVQLAPVDVIVLLAVLLDGDVCEVDVPSKDDQNYNLLRESRSSESPSTLQPSPEHYAYILSISFAESSYLTVQNRQKPCLKR